ncbi:(2Fe-2S)-binding protein [Agrobacterium fabrum]
MSRSGLRRTRRVCCIRYLIGGLDYCKTCPCPSGGGRRVNWL